MRKIRLFAMLAVLATFSTVFAAWQYINYNKNYWSEPVDLTLTVDGSALTSKKALTMSVDNAETITITYNQSTESPNVAVASVSDDLSVTVVGAEPGAIAKYNFYYLLYSANYATVGSVYTSDYYDFETDDVEVESYEGLTKLNIDENGKGIIPKEELSNILEDEFTFEGNSLEGFSAALESFKDTVGKTELKVRIFAQKVK